MSFYPQGEEWYRSHEHVPAYNDNCAICGDRHMKRNMFGIYLVKPGSSVPKKWCHVCARCIANVADLLGTSIGG